MAFAIACATFNVFCARALPVTEGIFGIVHILRFFVFLIVLWIKSDHASTKDVFTLFEDNGGWGNKGLSALVGITTPLRCFLGPGVGAHMSEELKDSSRVSPSAMMWASVCNAALGIIVLVTLCFYLGPDWQEGVLGLTEPTQTGIPIIQVLYNSTGSEAATILMMMILIVVSFVATITVIASFSRQVWAFARNKGFPFSSYMEFVSRYRSSAPQYPLHLLEIPGTSRLGYPRQRSHHNPRNLPAHLLPQIRLRRSPRRYHQPLRRRPLILIYPLNWQRRPQALAEGRTTFLSLVP